MPAGVWSATPTPFTSSYDLDVESIPRMVEHHLRLGVSGVMLAGTCGEGAWMRERDRELLTKSVVEASRGRLRVAVQVTDNSVGRMLDNAALAAQWGAELAVVAAPYFLFNATPARLTALYRDTLRQSPLPIGFYDRGANSPFSVPLAGIAEIMAEPNVAMVKDSSVNAERRSRYLEAKARRAGLTLLSGDEFDCITPLREGYDGLLLGGGIFNGAIALKIIAAVREGNYGQAAILQARMNDLMHRVYGGPKIECWLTGLKELLVQMGVFSTNANLLEYPLTETCREQIRAAVTGEDGLGFAPELLGEISAVPARA